LKDFKRENREQNRKTRKAIGNGGRYAGNEQLAVSNEQWGGRAANEKLAMSNGRF
jgi:hypothetical protein